MRGVRQLQLWLTCSPWRKEQPGAAPPTESGRSAAYRTGVTLAAVWIETRRGSNSPLCFASDSRTTPGPIEGVTKVVLFGREDLAGVWAGDYRYATLLVGHLDAVFTASDAMRRRDIDIERALRQAAQSVKRHLERATRPAVPAHELNRDAQLPGRTTLLVGGYSITGSQYVVLRVDWTPVDLQWRTQVSRLSPRQAIFIGDDIAGAKSRARQARAYRTPPASDDWRMEPLAAIYRACVDSNKRTIGGTIQLVKAYQHGSTRAYGMIEPIGHEGVSVRGTVADARATRELATTGLIVDLSRWSLRDAYFGAMRR